jgi:hypothetical protein
VIGVLLLLLFERLIFKFAFPCQGHFLPIAFLLKGKSFFGPFLDFKLLIMDAKRSLGDWGQGQLWLKLMVGDDVVALRNTTPTTPFLSFLKINELLFPYK